ncbi:MAG TPA: DRTGG domain-containing protein [Candidatus Hydrothermia bacterium]|nr:serine kinase [Candidatus Hydrothermae bacterium]MDD3648578.1 DRTGG domain-containing protein [Candidatus Hydrothermia bacterium]MDD5572680.1 DRTGG domain-containing protein [Candidatus Hydrothermia bacterium]HOK22562.1 DRTGG domain-containing protein [Candidatus Hydrothermia bacterium]HOL23269.1 DRTGG domain-containing protein [Candidatus Hydrothermia bacterium]
MKLAEIIGTLNLRIFTPGIVGFEDVEIKGGYVSDLLSDVIASLAKGDIWITIQKHFNIVAVAKLKDAGAILITKGFEPDKNTIDKANEEGVILLGTELGTFEITGKLYNLLKYGESK